MISSFMKEALHISEKTGEASMPKVIYPITLRITYLPFLLSLSLITVFNALSKHIGTSSVHSSRLSFSTRSNCCFYD